MFFLFDLKTGKLTHQDTGQMDMYIRMFDDLKKQDDDNPTIEIILCTEKDETVVKYSILNESKQLIATKYMLYLPTEEELIAEIEREKGFLKLINGCEPPSQPPRNTRSIRRSAGAFTKNLISFFLQTGSRSAANLNLSLKIAVCQLKEPPI
ncbi:DUF1016 domain-containing protein [Dyadobacter sp. CY345]|nr:PDDEXK nuclease domain-containing protein [Dyadobacter sp. CY345]MCF2447622.1 DUF1016 domain-containing protein [Dyadobacter sp. CY345]